MEEKNGFGKLIVITGCTAGGKDTIVAKLLKEYPDLKRVITYTSRKPRNGELEGAELHFISREEFLEMVQRGEFLEYVEYADNLYGTTKKVFDPLFTGEDIIWRMDASGATKIEDNIKKSFGEDIANHIIKNTLIIYISVPNLETAKRRMESRGMSEEEIEKRVRQDAKYWNSDTFENMIKNPDGSLNQTFGKITELINNFQE